MKQIASGLATAAFLLGVLAPMATAGFNPFEHAELLHSSEKNPHERVVVKTKGGEDAPKRVRLQSDGEAAKAAQRAGSSSIWVVSERTAGGRALIEILTAEIDESGSATLNATAAYSCGSRFKYSFEIDGYNRRAEPQFKQAFVCL